MRIGGIDLRKMNTEAAEVLNRLLGIRIDVTERLDTYTVAIQQMVAIARALYIASVRILILDEPTSSLDDPSKPNNFSSHEKTTGAKGSELFLSPILLVKYLRYQTESRYCGMESLLALLILLRYHVLN